MRRYGRQKKPTRRKPVMTGINVAGLIHEDERLRETIVRLTQDHAAEVRRLEEQIAAQERVIRSQRSELTMLVRRPG